MNTHGSSSEYCARVDRVLEAVRAWRKAPAYTQQSGPDSDLINAIDALDAPQERYIVEGRCVMERDHPSRGYTSQLCSTPSPAIAEKIAAALNAADTREGSRE